MGYVVASRFFLERGCACARDTIPTRDRRDDNARRRRPQTSVDRLCRRSFVDDATSLDRTAHAVGIVRAEVMSRSPRPQARRTGARSSVEDANLVDNDRTTAQSRVRVNHPPRADSRERCIEKRPTLHRRARSLREARRETSPATRGSVESATLQNSEVDRRAKLLQWSLSDAELAPTCAVVAATAAGKFVVALSEHAVTHAFALGARLRGLRRN